MPPHLVAKPRTVRIEPPGSIDPTRFAGDPPPSLVGHFRGRETELAEVTAMLESHRLVAVLGRAGAGKTMLISKLFESQTPERPLLRLSLLDRPGSLEQRFFESLAGSDDDARAHVRQPLPAADRLRALRRRRHDLDRVVVVLDDVQAAADEARLLIDACVETDGAPRLVALSRRALTLGEAVEARYADRCAEVVVDASLAEDDAREVLRALDPQGALGLRDAPDALVRATTAREPSRHWRPACLMSRRARAAAWATLCSDADNRETPFSTIARHSTPRGRRWIRWRRRDGWVPWASTPPAWASTTWPPASTKTASRRRARPVIVAWPAPCSTTSAI